MKVIEILGLLDYISMECDRQIQGYKSILAAELKDLISTNADRLIIAERIDHTKILVEPFKILLEKTVNILNNYQEFLNPDDLQFGIDNLYRIAYELHRAYKNYQDKIDKPDFYSTANIIEIMLTEIGLFASKPAKEFCTSVIFYDRENNQIAYKDKQMGIAEREFRKAESDVKDILKKTFDSNSNSEKTKDSEDRAIDILGKYLYYNKDKFSRIQIDHSKSKHLGKDLMETYLLFIHFKSELNHICKLLTKQPKKTKEIIKGDIKNQDQTKNKTSIDEVAAHIEEEETTKKANNIEFITKVTELKQRRAEQKNKLLAQKQEAVAKLIERANAKDRNPTQSEPIIFNSTEELSQDQKDFIGEILTTNCDHRFKPKEIISMLSSLGFNIVGGKGGSHQHLVIDNKSAPIWKVSTSDTWPQAAVDILINSLWLLGVLDGDREKLGRDKKYVKVYFRNINADNIAPASLDDPDHATLKPKGHN